MEFKPQGRLVHFPVRSICGAVIAYSTFCTTASGASILLATVSNQQLIFDLDYGSTVQAIEVTPWLQYRIVDPNAVQKTTLSLGSLTVQPGGDYQLFDSVSSLNSGFELTTFLTDGITAEGLAIQEFAAGYAIRTGSQQFEISAFDSFENWILSSGLTQMHVPRLSANDLGGYEISHIEGELRIEVLGEPVPNTGSFFQTSFEMQYFIYGTPIPEPSMCLLMFLGSYAILYRKKRLW